MRGIDSIAKATTPRSRSRSMPVGVGQRLEEPDETVPDASEATTSAEGERDAGDAVGAGRSAARVDELAPASAYALVGEPGRLARAALDAHLEPRRASFATSRGRARHDARPQPSPSGPRLACGRELYGEGVAVGPGTVTATAQTSSFVRARRMTSSVNSRRAGVAAEIGGADAVGDGLEAGLADRAPGRLRACSSSACESSAAPARIIAIGFATSLPSSDGRGPVRGLGHERVRHVVVAERDEQRLRACDRAEERQHEVGEDVAVAVQRRDDHRRAARRDEQRERRVDQLRLVRHVGMARRGRVHLLLQHPLVDRADGVLRAAEDLRARALGLPERELRDRVADAPLDALGAERDLVVALALAPLLRAVGVADRHAHDRDRRVHAAERHDAGDAPAGAHDDLAADLLAQDAVRRADVARALGRDRRGLQAEPVLADRAGGLVDDRVLRRAPTLEREVEADEARARRRSRPGRAPQGLLEQLLPGLVALEHDDGLHGA